MKKQQSQYVFSQSIRLGAVCFLILSTLGLAGCGPGEKAEVVEEEVAPRGMISEVDGRVRLLTPEEEKTVCSVQKCEPDIAYQEIFARRRAKPPVTTVPVPQPTGTMPADAQGETHDYSKRIMRLYESWDMTRGLPEVVVAVIDSGVDVSHPDLRDNIWVNQAEKAGRAGVDDDGNGYVDDVHGWDFVDNEPARTGSTDHGTHVAGIIGAAINGQGTAGVAPRVKIMPLKFINSGGNGYTSDAVAAMEYAVKNGAHIINNSWGGSGYSSFLEKAVTNTVAAGVIFVAASGNNGKNTDSSGFYPANYEGVLSVGSTDERDQLSSFSNYGVRTVELAAPGSNILSTIRYGDYDVISGTSMAAPQVAGVLALGMSLRQDLPFSRIRSELCSTSIRLFPDYIQCGRVDVAGYLRRLSSL